MRILSESELQEILGFCADRYGRGTAIRYNPNFPFFAVYIPGENGGIVVDFDGKGRNVALEWIKQEAARRVSECTHGAA